MSMSSHKVPKIPPTVSQAGLPLELHAAPLETEPDAHNEPVPPQPLDFNQDKPMTPPQHNHTQHTP